VSEQVEGIEEAEVLVVDAEGVRVLAAEVAEVVRYLKDVWSRMLWIENGS
jgi:hypothetical protein